MPGAGKHPSRQGEARRTVDRKYLHANGRRINPAPAVGRTMRAFFPPWRAVMVPNRSRRRSGQGRPARLLPQPSVARPGRCRGSVSAPPAAGECSESRPQERDSQNNRRHQSGRQEPPSGRRIQPGARETAPYLHRQSRCGSRVLAMAHRASRGLQMGRDSGREHGVLECSYEYSRRNFRGQESGRPQKQGLAFQLG